MIVIGLDPGSESSAAVVYQDGKVLEHVMAENLALMQWLTVGGGLGNGRAKLVIEKIACYGMAVGAEVFETVFWSGIFARTYGLDYTDRITRGEVKLHLCRSMRAKDANVRQAILDKFGGKEVAIGKKANPGPLFGIKSHCFAALGVAITYAETKGDKNV